LYFDDWSAGFLLASVRNTDPHDFGPPGSGSISQRYESESASGSPFPIKVLTVERTEIKLAK
jgi:hypothetical protein